MNGSSLGARLSSDLSRVEFRLCAPRALRVELWIYAAPTEAPPVLRVPMTSISGEIFTFSATLSQLQSSGIEQTFYYGYRAWGPNWIFDPRWVPGSGLGFVADVDRDGNRFNPNKLLLDPYALEVSHNPLTPTQTDLNAYKSGSTFRLVDTGPIAPKGIALEIPAPNYGTKPTRAFKDEIIYEVHLRGFTKNDPDVPTNVQGTYRGAALKVPYLTDLGVTAIEFQPIHETQNSLNDVPQFASAQNYWGYDSISYFAPNRRYSSDSSAGGPTREWIAMVKAFHDAGIKVYIDVVYNHHNEGDVDYDTGTIGTIYSLRGLDNSHYYEDLGDSTKPNLYENDNGVGPNLNAASTIVRNLVLDSLKYWSGCLGVDGFRFDLAAILGNENAGGGYSFNANDPDNILNRVVREMPARGADGGSGVDLIAEPYSANAQGQEQGRFPFGWSEWNDRFRDVFRASQNKLGFVSVTPGQMATRLAGSDDLFRANGRKPWNSVNYVVCHDGFTLRDLYSYSATNNNQPSPYGPSPGGRSAADEMCWDHGGDPVQQRQATRTGLALLLLSSGVPIITGGSEMYRTQFGNNNAFNLDTVANWLDWSLLERERTLFKFTRELIHFRLAHACLRPRDFFSGTDHNGNGIKDLTWCQNTAAELDAAYFQNANNHFLAFRLDDSKFIDSAGSVYVAYNGWVDTVQTTAPRNLGGKRWFLVADTSASAEPWGNIHSPGQETELAVQYPIAGRSLILAVEL